MYLYFSEFNKNHYTFDYYPDIIRLNDGWRKKVMASKVWYIPAENELLVKRVGIYCRVSTSEKAQLYSLSNQISALTRNIQVVLHKVCQCSIKAVFSEVGQLQSLCGNYENVNSSINIIPYEISCWQVYRDKFY